MTSLRIASCVVVPVKLAMATELSCTSRCQRSVAAGVIESDEDSMRCS